MEGRVVRRLKRGRNLLAERNRQRGLRLIHRLRNELEERDDLRELAIPVASIRYVVEEVAALSTELIQHLQGRHDDLARLDWEVFEHLVAELLAAKGFRDVRLVGRDYRTSADIFAVFTPEGFDIDLRFFVEVKHGMQKVGIEVINTVLGALFTERPQVGWHAGMVVSYGGFKSMMRYTPLQLKLMGLELRSRDDLLRWLSDYRPNRQGLWLPDPIRTLPLEESSLI
jgi:predicted Mrr-cat superfamily restriction endonuclease